MRRFRKPEICLSRREVLRMFEEGESIELLTTFGARVVMYPPHSSLCAVTSSGHLGSCTCGAASSAGETPEHG